MGKTRFEVPAAKRRNPYALEARMRTGAGSHGHPAREESRNACRKWDSSEIDPDQDEESSIEWFFDMEQSDA